MFILEWVAGAEAGCAPTQGDYDPGSRRCQKRQAAIFSGIPPNFFRVKLVQK
jgi:hypothetical protein